MLTALCEKTNFTHTWCSNKNDFTAMIITVNGTPHIVPLSKALSINIVLKFERKLTKHNVLSSFH